MLNINEEYINSTAPNESAVKNGWGLLKKKNFVKLGISGDETLLMGECLGSGASNYICSVDFIKSENPVFRCTCPSRQIPCKHTLGLMYAYISRNKFEEIDVPEDITLKREKAEQREEKKKAPASVEKKVNKSALAKKVRTQLEGLELLERLAKDIVKRGFAAIDAKTLDMLEEQGKALNSAYLSGAQRLLREFILIFQSYDNKEQAYGYGLNVITAIYSLCKRGREHLNKRLQDPEMALDGNSTIDELLGHTWQASELEAAGLCESDAELIQLFFNVYIDEARKEYIDIGYWASLKDGAIHKSCNYRPFRAAKHIKEEDSIFSAAQISRLYVYPGEINKRVRWEEMVLREIVKEDFSKLSSHAKTDYAEIIKIVKNIIKNPLSDKYPVFLLHYNRLGTIGRDYVIEDSQGRRIILRNTSYNIEMPSTHMLHLLKKKNLENGSVLVRFEHNLESGELTAQPLSIITDSSIIRLLY